MTPHGLGGASPDAREPGQRTVVGHPPLLSLMMNRLSVGRCRDPRLPVSELRQGFRYEASLPVADSAFCWLLTAIGAKLRDYFSLSKRSTRNELRSACQGAW